jgi:uncharacterized protein
MRKLRRALARTGMAVMLAVAAPVPAISFPAMWSVRDDDTTVHLFGTIHLLSPEMDWRTPELDLAMGNADTLWLEIDVLSDTSGAMAMIRSGTSPKLPLKERLSPADYAEVEYAAAMLDVPMETIERLRPWLAAVTLAVEAIRRMGYDAAGVDLELANEARDRDLPVKAFETGAQQIAIFAGLGAEEEAALLMQTIRMIEEGPTIFPTMFEAWGNGDRAAMERLLVDDLVLADANLADALLARRNKAWAERFEEIMAEPGTRIVAVGAAHLVGPDSLPALLEARGWRVELVQGQP